MATKSSPPVLPPAHDHQRCLDQAMATARSLCAKRDCRLTPIREQVLAAIWSSHRPIGAYQILDQLAATGDKTPAPPTVYRALDFLLAQNLVHRIASLNAFVGCSEPQHQHEGHFMICQCCGEAIEVDSAVINRAVSQAADHHGFVVTNQCVEVSGICQHCSRESHT